MKSIQFSWALLFRLIPAIILLQTLYFKFSGAPESVYIFTQIGLEPYGRYLIGTLELVASIMLFIPSVRWIGALLAMGLMGGALMSHLGPLGIEVMNDGGYLFSLALAVLIFCGITAWIERNHIPVLNKILPASK